MSSSAVATNRTLSIGRKEPKAAPLSSAFTIPELVGNSLVVDDNARARQSMVEVLRAAGHDVVASASAIEALKIAAHRKTNAQVNAVAISEGIRSAISVQPKAWTASAAVHQ